MQKKHINTSFNSFINSNEYKTYSNVSLTERLKYNNIEKINEGILKDALESIKSLISRGLNTVNDYMESISIMFGGIKNKLINTSNSLFKGTRVIEVFDSKNGDMISQIIDRYQDTPAWKQWSDFLNSGNLSYPVNEAVTSDELKDERDRLKDILTTAEFRDEGYARPEFHTGATEIKSVDTLMSILKDAFEITVESKLEKGSSVRSVVPYILGAPAIGKTALVSKFVEEVGGVLVELKLGSLLPSDLKGLPFVDMEGAINMALQKELESDIQKYGKEFNIADDTLSKFTKVGATSNFAIPNLGFPIVSREVLDNPQYRELFNKAGIGKDGIRPVIVYIDEFVQADKEVIDRANQLIQQGNVTGEEFTAPHVFIVVTSNRPQDNPKSIGTAPFWGSGALKDRFTFFNFIPSAQDWIDWAESSNNKLLKKYDSKFSIKDLDKYSDDKVRTIGGRLSPKEKPFKIHPDILDWFLDMDPTYKEKNLYNSDGGSVVYREQMFYQPVKFGGVAPSPRRWEQLSDWYTKILWKNEIDSIFDLDIKSDEYMSLMEDIKDKFIMNVGVIAYSEWEKFVDARMSLDTKHINMVLDNPIKAKLKADFLHVKGGKTKNRIIEYIMKSYIYKKSNGVPKKYLEYALNLAIHFMRYGSGELFSAIFSSINGSAVLKNYFGLPESINLKDTAIVKYYTTLPTWMPQVSGSSNMSYDNELASVDAGVSSENGFSKTVKVKDKSKVWVNPITGTPYTFVNLYMRNNANDPKLIEKGFYLTSNNLLLRTGKFHSVPGIDIEANRVKNNRDEDTKTSEIKLDENGCYMFGSDKYFCEVYTPDGLFDENQNKLPLEDIDKVQSNVVIYKNGEYFGHFEMSLKVSSLLMLSLF